MLLAGQAPFLPGIPAKKRGHQENVSGAQSASENNRSRGADGVEKEPAKCQLADRSPALHNREAQRARERKWHRQPTTALQIHLPFQNLQLYHFAISSSSLFFVPSNSSTCPARERGNALFQVPGQKKRALHFASLDEYVTGNAPREETSAPIRGRVLMSVRDFDASSSSYDSTTRHD